MAFPLLFFVFVFASKSPHLTLKTVFGSLMSSYPSRNLSDSVARFVQLIETYPRFLLRRITRIRASRWCRPCPLLGAKRMTSQRCLLTPRRRKGRPSPAQCAARCRCLRRATSLLIPSSSLHWSQSDPALNLVFARPARRIGSQTSAASC
jgi:hypothetical protein